MTTSGRLILPLSEPALGDTALPISGATLTVYLTGTLTLASLFADSALATPITNPQTANSAGRFYAQSTTIFADASQGYDCVLAYPSTGQSFTYTNLTLLGVGSNTSGFAPINSPAFTGTPTAPTPALNDNSQKIATTAFVKGQNYAPLASPALTGTPTAPTATVGTNTTQIATTAFVQAALGASQSLATPGYYTAPGGLIIQWGAATTTAGSVAVTFPITFPNGAFQVFVGADANNAAFANVHNSSFTTSGVTIQSWLGTSSGGSVSVRWMALGH